MEVKKKIENVKNRIQKTPVLSIVKSCANANNDTNYATHASRLTKMHKKIKRLEKCTSHAMNCEFYKGQSEESQKIRKLPQLAENLLKSFQF